MKSFSANASDENARLEIRSVAIVSANVTGFFILVVPPLFDGCGVGFMYEVLGITRLQPNIDELSR